MVPHPAQGWTSRKTYPPSSSYSTGSLSKNVLQVGQEAESNCFLIQTSMHYLHLQVKHKMSTAILFLPLHSKLLKCEEKEASSGYDHPSRTHGVHCREGWRGTCQEALGRAKVSNRQQRR